MIMTLLATQKQSQPKQVEPKPQRVQTPTPQPQQQTFDAEQHLADRKARADSGWVENPQLPGLRTIEINITELCNRTCSFCPRSDPAVYANQKLFMSKETASNLGKQLAEAKFDGEIHVTGFGEPMTHPRIVELIKAITFHWSDCIEVTTNGDRLETDARLINDLYAAGVSRLTIDSYDGAEQYQRYVHMMRHWPEDRWRIRNHYDDPDKDSDELIAEYNFNNRAGNSAKGEVYENQCYLPFYKTMIDWNGNIVLCCNDWQRAAGTFGNIDMMTLSELWTADPLTNIRQQLAEGQRLGPACGKCNIQGTKFGQASFDLLTSEFV